MNHPEHNEQTALFRWSAIMETAYPELRWMYAIPNSARRSPRQGAWMKDEGLKAGVWDIHLPAPRDGVHGLFIEMKIGRNKLTPEQTEFKNALEKYYQFAVCYSWIDAKIAILHYLEGEKF